MKEFRTGLGWDNHRTLEGRPMIIGGIRIESSFGLDGHSDADILLHAVTDALLGALGLGDIGMHFPDTDPRWKGASSDRFLEHAAGLVREAGWEIGNVDTTVILERPKLKEYRGPIRSSLAAILRVREDQVSVKFKTSEKVGPVGEGRSAEAQAVVLIFR
jgi:2-C-methyl-D-erythritol 2,4-cyclodiphosphate synthase